MRLGRAYQPLVQRGRVLAHGELADAIEHPHIMRPLGFLDHVREHLAAEQFAAAIVEHPRARGKPGFLREIADQELGEGVDGVDPEPAAGAIEHAGEKAARTFTNFGRVGRPQVAELLEQFCFRQPHPARQHRVDAVGHFRRARLGKGQAQDLPRRDILAQQQAQHPRRQDLRLARPRRCREPDIVLRRGGEQLVVLERENETIPAAHAPLSLSVRRTSHSSSRISWSYSL